MIQKTRNVFWENINYDIQTFINEASDDELEKILVEVNQRKNQSLFKNNIVKKFNGKCLISENNVHNVLEAAHIIPHSISGMNSSSNGILLRSDIHKLFDANLILIDPENLNIVVHNSILDSEYGEFHLKPLNFKIDKDFLNNLSLKWEQHNWK